MVLLTGLKGVSNVTKLYRFTQTLDNRTEPYYQMKGTLEQIMDTWYYSGVQYRVIGQYDQYKTTSQKDKNQFKMKIRDLLDKQKVYVEIVDDSVYGVGWTTKIEEIEE